MVSPDLVLVAAVGLLVIGVIGTVIPFVPGVLLSVFGVVLYWWGTGYTEPGTLFVGVTVLFGILALIVDYAGSAISAKVGGASTRAVLAAAGAGAVMFLIAGPVGIIVGVAITVFASEFYHTRQMDRSVRAAFYATIGLLASTLVQFLFALSILTGFIVAVIL